MAKIYPSYEEIKELKVQPTKGEYRLIDFLLENLNDEYEIFFQPFLNGDCPDVILMRKDGGVMVIEVKDWKLDSYHLDFRKRWFVSHNNALIKSPISQVLKYKENIYNLHIDNLLELKLKEYKYWFVVNCAIFFYNETKNNVDDFLLTPFEIKKEFLDDNDAKKEAYDNIEKSKSDYLTFLNKNVDILGIDSLTKDNFDKILYKSWISRKSYYFKEELYNSFKRYLKPSFHSLEDGKNFNYTKKQTQLSESKSGEQKIKGIVGSGKTLVLARRAVNAYKRTDEPILVLTYNISLKNYIHDKISNVRADFDWKYFHLLNYHDFFNSALNNLGIEFDIPENFDNWEHWQKENFFNDNYYGNINLFEEHKDKITKYQTILIDEVQDYRTVWLRILKKYFLANEGEFVVFGDSKQDIYNRVSLVNNKKELVIPDSPGRWAELNQSFRLTPTITKFASLFQNKFLLEKHIADEFENVDFQAALFDKVHYKYFGKLDLSEISDFVIHFSRKIQAHPNDVCVLSLSIDIIRELDKLFRDNSKESSYIMSETDEYYKHLEKQYGKTKKFHQEIDRIRKNKKLHFWMNSGITKYSTVHSYKGWEINTLFLLIQKDAFEETYKELIYTGFTRCMNNLVLLNIDDLEFDEWINTLQIVQKE